MIFHVLLKNPFQRKFKILPFYFSAQPVALIPRYTEASINNGRPIMDARQLLWNDGDHFSLPFCGVHGHRLLPVEHGHIEAHEASRGIRP